jgi:dihydroorotase-like cyclic amidohydrolase
VKTLIKNRTVVTASETLDADVVEDEKVAAIAVDIDVQPHRLIDATEAQGAFVPGSRFQEP